MVVEHRHLRADGSDTRAQCGAARLHHRRSVLHALGARISLKLEVLADYRHLPLVAQLAP